MLQAHFQAGMLAREAVLPGIADQLTQQQRQGRRFLGRKWYGGCGKVKGGQHLRYPDHTPLANALLTMLDRAGVPVDKVGDSTQKFAEV